jgi:hypothetical protein
MLTELGRYAGRSEVMHVLVGGRLLIENTADSTIDLERLPADARKGAARVRTVREGTTRALLGAAVIRFV